MRKQNLLHAITTLLLVFISIFSISCKGPGSNSGDTSFEQKPVTGIPAMFEDSLGFYNEHASVFEENGERYVYYTKNINKYNDSTECIFVRKGIQENGKWSFGNESVALNTSESGWDSTKVFQADVIKGSFLFNSEN